MDEDRFEGALAVVLGFEGGFVDDPRDGGGATNWGVTQAVLSQARGRAADAADVRALTREEAAAIYRRLYWRAAGCDDLAPGLDLMVFDCAVNMGVGAAVRLLQGALGLRRDGAAGPVTLAAAREAGAAQAIRRMARAREARYRALAGFDRFGAGWLRRLRAVEALAAAQTAAPLAEGLPA